MKRIQPALAIVIVCIIAAVVIAARYHVHRAEKLGDKKQKVQSSLVSETRVIDPNDKGKWTQLGEGKNFTYWIFEYQGRSYFCTFGNQNHTVTRHSP
jgi:hypothetical protein